MKVAGKSFRTVWLNNGVLQAIDQRKLPFQFEIATLPDVAAVAVAIQDMLVRGAGCIGATAGFGMALAARECGESLEKLTRAADLLKSTRPTAVNLAWAVDRIMAKLQQAPASSWVALAEAEAQAIANEDAAACQKIGQFGLELLRQRHAALGKAPGEPLNILTHCNAGWLAFVDYGSATAPIYAAHDAGLPVHVWVDETRPRNQGARLTAWELAQHGVAHTVIVDNAGGHLMQRGKVDLVITGADRVTANGDVANKIGTYLKALAAWEHQIPFHVTLPTSTLDFSLTEASQIPIEERSPREMTHVSGLLPGTNQEQEIQLWPTNSPAANPAFDVTPAKFITSLITEVGIFPAHAAALAALRHDPN